MEKIDRYQRLEKLRAETSIDVVAGASKQLGGIAVDAHDSLIWLESRPYEAGYPNFYLFFFFKNVFE